MQPDNSNWFHMPSIESIIGATWIAGGAVVGFLWRLTVKVAMLEHTTDEREENTERRHQENIEVARGLRQQITNLTDRIDRLMDRLRP